MEAFLRAEAPYAAWVEANPAGYVLYPQTRLIHRATCQHVAPGSTPLGSLTRREKICDSDRSTLESYAREDLGFGVRLCSTCRPDEIGVQVPTVGRHPRTSDQPPPPLHQPRLALRRLYTWVELGELFGFSPSYLSVAGGMLPRPALGAVLLITHPDGARSFNYDDHWDGHDLVYTGRGKVGP
jgi:hypothetical protein